MSTAGQGPDPRRADGSAGRADGSAGRADGSAGRADGRAGMSALGARALALIAGGWANPERLAKVLQGYLGTDGMVEVPASAAHVLGTLEAAARRAGALASAQRVAAVQARFAALDVRLHVVGEPGYPATLATAWPERGAPLWLAVRSASGTLPEGPAVAVVGTREPTLDGLHTAEELGRVLARHGIVVISGLARGIDQAAHRGALAAGGRTVAVLGAGFDVDYPQGTGALREEIAASGGLATELAPEDPPRPRHFIARNRIVSGLADAVVVVEGRTRSGALATARLGLEQGRDVWAVPGPLRAATSQGPLALIRDGAPVLTRFTDIVEAVLGTATRARASEAGDGPVGPVGLSAAAAAVLRLLSAVPARPGTLAAGAGLPLPAVLAAVTELTSRGLAVSSPRGLVRG
jgi:DNA processing protein